MGSLGPVSTLKPWRDPDVTLFDFSRMVVNDPRLSFTGAAGRTYYDDSGMMRTAAVNEPRFETDTDVGRYLRLDGQSTNLSVNTGNPSIWGATAARMTANSIFAGIKMSKLIGNTDNSNHYTDRITAQALATGDVFSCQVALRAAEMKFAAVYVYSGPASNVAQTFVNLLTGELSNPSAAQVVRLADGVLLIKIPGVVAGAGVAATRLRIFPAINMTVTSAPNNNADGIWVGAAQMEMGGICTSFIETGATVVTRAAEALNLLGQEFLNAFNPAGWCVMVDSSVPGAPSATVGIANVYNPSIPGRLYQGITAPGASIAALTPPTGSQINIGTRGAIYLAGARVKTAAGYDGATYRSAVNGVIGNAPTAAAAISGADRMAIGSLTGTVNWTHKISSVRVYRRAVSINEMLQATMQ